MTEAILPCPSCCHDAPIVTRSNEGFHVKCPRCCMRGPVRGRNTKNSKDLDYSWAVSYWNALPREPSPQGTKT
jgi:hypothetical protein